MWEAETKFNTEEAGSGFGATVSAKSGSCPVDPTVHKVVFQPLPDPVVANQPAKAPSPRFFGINLHLSAELGKITIPVRDLINLESGSTLKMQRVADERVLLLLNESPFAHGEVVVINERFGIRVTSLLEDEPPAATGQSQGKEVR